MALETTISPVCAEAKQITQCVEITLETSHKFNTYKVSFSNPCVICTVKLNGKILKNRCFHISFKQVLFKKEVPKKER